MTILKGTAGSDRLTGGDGDDVLTGLQGNDFLYGGKGCDSLDGGDGNDYLSGDDGDDTLNGGAGDDQLFPEDGNDLIQGGSGSDLLNYSGTSAKIVLDLVAGTVICAAGNDTLTGIERVSGSSDGDSLTGDAGANLLWGAEGNDTVFGGFGDDTLVGGGGNDTLEGGTGNDAIEGDAGIDLASYASSPSAVTILLSYDMGTGGDGTEFIIDIENVLGSSYADYLAGDSAANVLTGAIGDDTLEGAGGNDQLDGGVGRDVAEYFSPRASLTWVPVAGGWVVTDQTVGGAGTDTLTGVERLRVGEGGVALDLDGNAGVVAKILGAVFGAPAVTNETFVGMGLALADSGIVGEALVQMALDAKLGAGASDDSVVDLLYTNVVGAAPSPGDHGYFVALLTDGVHTHASLALLAAELDINEANIGLAGLMTSGLDYA